MSQSDNVALYYLKGAVSDLSPEQIQRVRDHAEKIKALANTESDGIKQIAFGLAAIEIGIEWRWQQWLK